MLGRRRYQKFMSYMTGEWPDKMLTETHSGVETLEADSEREGWYALLGWQSSLVGTALAAAQLFQAVIVLYNPWFASKGTGCRAFKHCVLYTTDYGFWYKAGSAL